MPKMTAEEYLNGRRKMTAGEYLASRAKRGVDTWGPVGTGDASFEQPRPEEPGMIEQALDWLGSIENEGFADQPTERGKLSPRHGAQSYPGSPTGAKAAVSGLTRGLTLGALRPGDEDTAQMADGTAIPLADTKAYQVGEVAGEFAPWGLAFKAVSKIKQLGKLGKLPWLLKALGRGSAVGAGVETARQTGGAIHGEGFDVGAIAESAAIVGALDTALGGLGRAFKGVQTLVRNKKYAAAKTEFDRITAGMDSKKIAAEEIARLRTMLDDAERLALQGTEGKN